MLALIATALLWMSSRAAAAILPVPDLRIESEGQVLAIARAPDGRVVIGGRFQQVDGIPRANLARLESDGSLDASWNPGADESVHALAFDAAGNLFVGGTFATVGGSARSRLAKFDATGALDPLWNPSPNDVVFALAFDGDGALYAGGRFTTIGGAVLRGVAKLSSTSGDVDPNWNILSSGVVNALAVDAEFVYLGGNVTVVGAMQSRRLARASRVGVVDAGWLATTNGQINAIALDGGGALLAGGLFNSANGESIRNLARFTGPTGTVDAAWTPDPTPQVNAIAVDGDRIYVAGAFGIIDDEIRFALARLGSDGRLDPGWKPSVSQAPTALALGGAGEILIGGNFRQVNGQLQLSFARLTDEGALLGAAEPSVIGSIAAVARQQDGGLILGGSFERIDGVPRSNLARLRPDGSLDTDWGTPIAGSVFTLALDSNDDVYIGGNLNSLGEVTRYNLIRLSGSGSGAVDPAFAVTPTGFVKALAIDAQDRLYVAGDLRIAAAKDVLFRGVIRIVDDQLDTVWNPYTLGTINSLALDGDALYFGGVFSSVNSELRSNLAKVSTGATAEVDASWAPYVTDQGAPFYGVDALALDGEGHVYAGGDFHATVEGQLRHHLIRIDTADGSIDAGWNPAPDGRVTALALLPQGDVLVGGTFGTIGAAPASHLARLTPDTAQRQWLPAQPDGWVRHLTLADRTVYLAGYFHRAAPGVARHGVAAFSLDALLSSGFED